MRTTTKKLAAVALAGAMTLGMLSIAQSASAAPIGGGTITITPLTGSADTNPMLLSMKTNIACPAPATSNATYAYQNGVNKGTLSAFRQADTLLYGDNGLSKPLNMDLLGGSNPFLSRNALASRGLSAGDWEMRFYCFEDINNLDFTEPYIPLAMTLDAAGTWAVKGAVVEPPAGAATTTSLTAVEVGTSKTVALSATVKKADGTTATDAAGTVQFSQDGAPVGDPIAVADGVATYTTSALADGNYSFTAAYTSSNGTYVASASTGSSIAISTVVVIPPGAQTETAVIDVTIPANTGAVSFSGLQKTISLGTAVLESGLFKASGNLGPVVITDTRQDGASPWSLTGTVTDFKDGAKTLDGKYLGWTPALVGSPNAGTAGPVVLPAPATVAGLKAPANVLASGSVVADTTTTTVGAKLDLAAPGNTAAGFYKSTLTLTLVS